MPKVEVNLGGNFGLSREKRDTPGHIEYDTRTDESALEAQASMFVNDEKPSNNGHRAHSLPFTGLKNEITWQTVDFDRRGIKWGYPCGDGAWKKDVEEFQERVPEAERALLHLYTSPFEAEGEDNGLGTMIEMLQDNKANETSWLADLYETHFFLQHQFGKANPQPSTVKVVTNSVADSEPDSGSEDKKLPGKYGSGMQNYRCVKISSCEWTMMLIHLQLLSARDIPHLELARNAVRSVLSAPHRRERRRASSKQSEISPKMASKTRSRRHTLFRYCVLRI